MLNRYDAYSHNKTFRMAVWTCSVALHLFWLSWNGGNVD